MPEGDTLKKAAALLGVMTGQRVTGFESPLPALARNDALGATISSVEARGKNLLIWFDATCALYTHLRMEGSWHRYLPGTPWRKPARQARVVVTTYNLVGVLEDDPRTEKIIAIDIKLSVQVNELLHHPTFQRLESAWRGLKFVVDRVDFRENIRVEMLNCSKEDLLADFEQALAGA